jgi:hypothetical protein
MKYQNLTIDQLVNAVKYLDKNVTCALEARAFSLADAILDKADSVLKELVARVQAEDPHTTEADIRYFEGLQHV